MDGDVKRNLGSVATWQRGLFMLLFLVIYSVVEAVWFLTALYQFIHRLITGAPRANVREFSERLCAYLYAVLRYISFGTEERPWPYAPWPQEVTNEGRAMDRYEPGDETVEPEPSEDPDRE